jgi:DNA-binding transcriptional LysR family regulator
MRPSGRLRMDAASPFVLHQLVPLVKPFRATYPDIELELVSNKSFTDLIEPEFKSDLTIRIGGLMDSGLHANLLARSPLHLVASPDILKPAVAKPFVNYA